jgi:antitoxin MazE
MYIVNSSINKAIDIGLVLKYNVITMWLHYFVRKEFRKMQVDIIQVGNSKGIRIPAALLKQLGIDTKLDMEVVDGKIILKPIRIPREGWDKTLKKMAEQNRIDDEIVFPAEMDNDLLEEWKDDTH